MECLGSGKGVFAGKKFMSGDNFEISPLVTMNYDHARETSLVNYVYASNEEGFCIVVFGAAMLYNHNTKIKNSGYAWNTEFHSEPPDARTLVREPFPTYYSLQYYARSAVNAGDEILTSYGGTSWFQDRDIPFDASFEDNTPREYFHRDINELQSGGHCLSDISVRASTIPHGGLGVFAEKSFKKGDIVSISPVLTLPRAKLLDPAANTILINYVFSVSDIEGAFLPIGLAAFVNHDSNKSNAKISWYDF